jgi:FPC/CPF motif-containing protein YcgG
MAQQYDESVTELVQELQEAIVKARDRETMEAPDAVISASEALLAVLGTPEEPSARDALRGSLDAHGTQGEATDGGIEPIAAQLLDALDSLKG